MPLIIKENITGDCILGVWKIEEPVEFLRQESRLTKAEENHYLSLLSPLRRKQWLSYHIIIGHLLEKEVIELTYDAYGKPYLKNKSHFLSVSHSGEYSAVILNKKLSVGIDIEKIGDRIERVKDMFLSKEELIHIGSMNRMEKLVVYWGAKEALYKIYGNLQLLCMQDITIEPFVYLCSGEGSTLALVKNADKTEQYTIFYRKIVDYMLVYTFNISSDKR
jgi:phosphopantetheinyl transferase